VSIASKIDSSSRHPYFLRRTLLRDILLKYTTENTEIDRSTKTAGAAPGIQGRPRRIPAYLTGRCVGGVASVFGTITVITPSWYETSAFAASMLWGKEMVRSKRPKARSIKW
jgi:hypothetical protein